MGRGYSTPREQSHSAKTLGWDRRNETAEPTLQRSSVLGLAEHPGWEERDGIESSHTAFGLGCPCTSTAKIKEWDACLLVSLTWWVAQVVKNLPANAGDVRDVGSITGLGRSLRGGQGNPLQYSCLENPMEGGA